MKITCKQAVDYISKKEEGKISATQRFALWRHLAICSLCRIFSVQNRIITKALGESIHEEASLSSTEKEAMLKNILSEDQ